MIASCKDDQAAVAGAARLLGACTVEVWEFERFVARVGPAAHEAPSVRGQAVIRPRAFGL